MIDLLIFIFNYNNYYYCACWFLLLLKMNKYWKWSLFSVCVCGRERERESKVLGCDTFGNIMPHGLTWVNMVGKGPTGTTPVPVYILHMPPCKIQRSVNVSLREVSPHLKWMNTFTHLHSLERTFARKQYPNLYPC